VAVALGINQPIHFVRDLAPLAPAQLARIAMATVKRFCSSADALIEPWHVPRIAGLDEDPVHALVQKAIVPLAIKAWEDINHLRGSLRFEHDHYLKMWGLTRPDLGVDYVLFDEAQDANRVIAAIVEDQTGQRIAVGDRCQAIYGWNGAIDAMDRFGGQRFYLSQSFRFGPAIAEEANKWLYVLGSPLRLRGFDAINSKVANLPDADAILCRTNAGALMRVVDSLAAGRKTAIVGGGGDIKRLAEAAVRLQQGQPCDHPELIAFSSWPEVRDYAEHDTSGSDLKTFVQLVDKMGAEEIVKICTRLTDERYAQTVVSTAHKAKGREWDRVRIAGDFREPGDDPETGLPRPIPRDDAMLAYVSVTRAKQVLDRSGLAWIDEYLAPAPARTVEQVSREVVTTAQDLIGPQPTLEQFLAPVVEANTPPSAAEHFSAITSAITAQAKECRGCMLCDDDYRASWPAPQPIGVTR
jgi:hypothetical protein